MIVGITRISMSAADFTSLGWRHPVPALGRPGRVGPVIRLRLQETPLFTELKAAGKSSTQPLARQLRQRGEPASSSCWRSSARPPARPWSGTRASSRRCSSCTNLGVTFQDAYLDRGTAIVLATPFFVVFGRLSDRIGRKPIILAGCLIAAITYLPIYHLMVNFAHPRTFDAHARQVRRRRWHDADGRPARDHAADRPRVDPGRLRDDGLRADRGVPGRVLPGQIRYTSLSIPYHLGNGWFGGFLPLIAASLLASTGNLYAGLIYPIVVALMTVVIGGLFVREIAPRPHLGRGRRRDREREACRRGHLIEPARGPSWTGGGQGARIGPSERQSRG